MLVKTSFNDSQVMYWEPAKYVARLRTLKTDDEPAAPEDQHGRGPRRRLGPLRLPARGGLRLRVHPDAARADEVGARPDDHAAQLRRGALGRGHRATLETLVNPATEEPLARAGSGRHRPGRGARVRADAGRARAARADLRRAGRAAEGDVRRAPRPPRRAARPGGRERRQHPQRRQVRRGRRDLHARRPTPRSARRWATRSCWWTARACTLGRTPALPRPAHRGAAPRRGRPHQRLQLPRLGLRREGGGGAAGRHARASASPPPARPWSRTASWSCWWRRRSCPRARSRCWWAAWATCSSTSGPQDVVAFTGSGDTGMKIRVAAQRDPPLGARQRGGGQPQRGRARAPTRSRAPRPTTSS